jgi:hypothetical protein
MPKQQDALFAVLSEMGFQPIEKPLSPRLEALPPAAQTDITDLYRRLGGVHPEPRLAPGGWDSCFEDDLVIEYDESQHFNRYRATTLNCQWAGALPWRQGYLDYCSRFEADCIKSRGWGGYWNNDSAERMFGGPGPQRELEGAGSPRWKQRALYDAMRDIAALHGAVRLVRLAVYDDVGGVTLGRALDGINLINRDALRSLITSRTLSP